MTVQFSGHTLEVPEGYEELAVAVLKCGIHVMEIGLEPDSDPPEFYVSFNDSSDCEQFADLIVACAEKPVLERLFKGDGCLTGSFSIEMINNEDDYRTMTVMEMCLPVSSKDDLANLFDGASKLVDAEVAYCDSGARRSNGTIHDDVVPKSEWDGHIFSDVPGVDSLQPGELVKLVFHATKPAHITERLWVKVTVVDEDDVTGTVDNHPASLTNLHRGDTVHFKRWHVMRVAPPKKQAEMRNSTLN